MREKIVDKPDAAQRRQLFDLATERQREGERVRPLPREEGPRDWTREDLYDRRCLVDTAVNPFL